MNEQTLPGVEGNPSDEEATVAFDYIKSHDFRVVWADGVVGGITPQDKIHCVFYAERPSIPQRQVFQVAESDGSSVRLGAEKFDKRVSRNSIVRELSCDVFMTADTARSLANWLIQRADEMDGMNNAR